MPVPTTYRGVWDDAGWADRRLARTTVIAVVILAVLAWVTFLGAAAVATPQPPDIPAMRYVPADGAALDIGSAATVESARFRGAAVVRGFSPAAMEHLGAPKDPQRSFWWRTTVLSSIPMRTFDRLYGLTPAGVELVAWAVGDNPSGDGSPLGAVLSPGVLVLPAAATPSSWSGDGTAVVPGFSEQASYRYSASSAPVSVGGRADCLETNLSISLTNPIPASDGPSTRYWTERLRFCAGEGVVVLSTAFSDTPNPDHFGGPSYGVEGRPLGAGLLTFRPVVPSPADLAGATATALSFVAGDSAFGRVPAVIHAKDLPLPNSAGVLVWADPVTGDVRAAERTREGPLWAKWYARPGTTPTGISMLGTLALVTTTDRRLTAYEAGGRRIWHTTLPEVAVGSVVVMADGQGAAIGSLDGTVTALDPGNGTVRWQADVGAGVVATAAGPDFVAVADSDGGVSFLHGSTGEVLAHSGGYHGRANGIATRAGIVVVWGLSWVDAYDRSGTRLWGITGRDLAEVALISAEADQPGVAVVTAAMGTTGYDLVTGEVRWHHGLGGVMTPLVGAVAVSDGGEVQVLDPAGTVGSTWAVPPGVASQVTGGGGFALRTSAGALWLVTEAPDGAIGGIRIAKQQT